MFRSEKVLRIICFEPVFLAFNLGRLSAKPYLTRVFFLRIFLPARKKIDRFGAFLISIWTLVFFWYGAGQYRSVRPKSVAAQGFSPFPKLPPPTTADTKVPSANKTRNFGRSWEFRPPDSPWYSSTQKISKSNIFCRLSCFLSNEFLSKFLKRKPDENRHGELSEWSKVQHSKCCRPKGL